MTSSGVVALLALTCALLIAQSAFAKSSCTVKVGIADAMTGVYATFGNQQIEGFLLWQSRVNDLGGIQVGEEQCNLELIIYDCQSDAVVTDERYRHLIEVDKVQFLIGPYSTGMGRIASAVAEEYEIPIVLSGSATDNVYVESNNYTIGVIAVASQYMASSARLMNLNGAVTVAVVSEFASFTQTVCSSAIEIVEKLGMKVVFDHVFTPTANLTNAEIKWAVHNIKRERADAVISCSYLKVGTDIVRHLEDMNYAPKAISLTTAVGNEVFEKKLGRDVRYLIGPVQWHGSIATTGDDVFEGSAAFFNDLYIETYGATPSYQAAQAAAAGVALQTGIESAGTLEKTRVMKFLKSLNFECFFGAIGIDFLTGANKLHPMVAVQYGRNEKLVAVAPEQIATEFAVYPMPTWDERTYDDDWYEYTSEIVMTVLASVCITISVGFIVFVLATRRHFVMVAASPIFLILALVASCFVYASVFTWQLYTTDAACAVLPWLLGIGATLFFACVAVRTWRISRLFKGSKSFKVRTVRDYQLAIIISVLVAIMLVFLGVWTGVDRLEAVVVIDDEDRPSEGYTECKEGDVTLWAWVAPMLAFTGAIGLAGIYFSFAVRNVENVVFNESKELMFAIYNCMLFGALVISLQVNTGADRETLFILRSLFIMGGMFIAILALMLPKVYGVFSKQTFQTGTQYDPKSIRSATKGFQTEMSSNTLSSTTGDMNSSPRAENFI
eukprot:TRINITY_DN2529_c0_g1_i1.p1 TRINITY_DN2529_c0_g1~~TRINITY_DN2529_c0_g1_i1.p1  ORF type:complete len:726 (+),score=223.33 TRINITY_DN2529_c0_g1_i1:225-2402(+)